MNSNIKLTISSTFNQLKVNFTFVIEILWFIFVYRHIGLNEANYYSLR